MVRLLLAVDCIASIFLKTIALPLGNDKLKTVDPAILKQAYGAAATLIVEFAKNDSTGDALG